MPTKGSIHELYCSSVLISNTQVKHPLELVRSFTSQRFFVTKVRENMKCPSGDTNDNFGNAIRNHEVVNQLNKVIVAQVCWFVNPPSVEVDTCETVHIQVGTPSKVCSNTKSSGVFDGTCSTGYIK